MIISLDKWIWWIGLLWSQQCSPFFIKFDAHSSLNICPCTSGLGVLLRPLTASLCLTSLQAARDKGWCVCPACFGSGFTPCASLPVSFHKQPHLPKRAYCLKGAKSLKQITNRISLNLFSQARTINTRNNINFYHRCRDAVLIIVNKMAFAWHFHNKQPEFGVWWWGPRSKKNKFCSHDFSLVMQIPCDWSSRESVIIAWHLSLI